MSVSTRNTKATIQVVEFGPIEEFVNYYNNSGYLAYEKLGERAWQIIVSELEKQDIKYEMFDRGKEGSVGGKAKAPASARQTVLRRQRGRGKDYETVEEIISDMHDLAGLRIALYYPNDFAKVEEIIKTRLVEVKTPQNWPDEKFGPFGYPTLDQGSSVERNSRFPGYYARHFRIRLPDEDVSEPAVRGKTLEIQLMTVLMHAWAKMYQELIYKPRPGVPQADEDDERLMDVSNGIIIAGEQVLRQIQINLDRKKSLGRQPFKNKHDLWSYVMETWLCNKDSTLSPAQQLWLKTRREGRYSDGLYQGLTRMGFANPEKLDVLVQASLDSEFGPGGLQQPLMSFIDAMIIQLVNHEDFKLEETKMLGFSLSDDRAPSHPVLARRARYQALIICSALRQRELNSLHILWQDEYFNDPQVPHPSGENVLDVLHPESTLQHRSLNKLAVLKVDEFCKHLMGYQETTWKLHCALARLGQFQVTQVDGGDLESGLTTCPVGLVAILSHSAKYENTSLRESFEVLEAAARDGFMGLFNDEMSSMFPRSLRNYRCPSSIYMATPRAGAGKWAVQGTDGKTGTGPWTVQWTGVSHKMVWVDPGGIRKYLDRLEA